MVVDDAPEGTPPRERAVRVIRALEAPSAQEARSLRQRYHRRPVAPVVALPEVDRARRHPGPRRPTARRRPGYGRRLGYTATLEAMMNELKTRLDALRGYL